MGGTALVNSTKYNINKGKTLISGTAYDIPFRIADWELLGTWTYNANGKPTGESTNFTYSLPANCVAVCALDTNSSSTGNLYQPIYGWMIDDNFATYSNYGRNNFASMTKSGNNITIGVSNAAQNWHYGSAYALTGSGTWVRGTYGSSSATTITMPEKWRFFCTATNYAGDDVRTIQKNANSQKYYYGAVAHTSSTIFNDSHPYEAGCIKSVSDGYLMINNSGNQCAVTTWASGTYSSTQITAQVNVGTYTYYYFLAS